MSLCTSTTPLGLVRGHLCVLYEPTEYCHYCASLFQIGVCTVLFGRVLQLQELELVLLE